MRIFYTSKFAREYNKLPVTLKEIAERQEMLFRTDPFHPHLKTHKLQGKLGGFWAFSLDYRYRIIFEFFENDTVHFHSVGTHAIYD